MTKPTITQAMINAYDEYTHLTLDRRGFMEKLTRLAGSGAAAAAIAPLLAASSARAAIIAEDDPKLKTEIITYKGSSGEMKGYLARPAEQSGKLGDRHRHPREPRSQPAHPGRRPPRGARRLRGARPRFPVVARRHAARRGQGARYDRPARPGQAVADGRRQSPSSKAMTAATARSARSASAGAAAWSTILPSTRRRSPPASPITAASRRRRTSPKIKAPLLLHYAGLDDRINAGIEAYKAALDQGRQGLHDPRL